MKILYLAPPSEPNTAGYIHTEEVISNLRKLGHSVDVIGTGKSLVDGILHTRQKPLWVRVLSPTPVGWLYRRLRGELDLLHLVQREIAYTVRLLCTRGRYDVVYSRHRRLNAAELLYRRLRNTPFVGEVNGFGADEMRVRKAGDRFSIWLVDKIERWNLRRSDRLVAVTTRMKVTLYEEYGVPKKRIAVVENGANAELFKPKDKAACMEELELRQGGNDKYTLCFTGTAWRVQGIETLIKALSLLGAEVGLLIVGSVDHAYHLELEELAVELGVQHREAFTDKRPQEEIPYWIGASDICIGPLTLGDRNKRTGLSPLKICEYLACGKPVVAARIPGLEFIEKEGLGVLVEPDSPEQVANAVNTLLGYPELRTEMGRKARQYVVENRSWERAAEQIVEVIEEARNAG